MLAGIAGFGLLALTMLAAKFVGHGSHAQKVTQAATDSLRATDVGLAPAPVARQEREISSGSPLADVSIPPLPADAPSVPDEYLLKLSGLVGLANSRYVHPDKGRWEKAIPIAQKLLQAPCDCEQRNWLNHFVEMGGYALSDSAHQYHDQAELMATLGRNDKDAMSRSERSN